MSSLTTLGTTAGDFTNPQLRIVRVVSGSANGLTSITIPTGVTTGNGLIVIVYGTANSSGSPFGGTTALTGFTQLGQNAKGNAIGITAFAKAASSGDASGGTWTLSNVAGSCDVAYSVWEVTGYTSATMLTSTGYSGTGTISPGSSKAVSSLVIAGVAATHGSVPTLTAAGWNIQVAANVLDSGAAHGLGYGGATSKVLATGAAPTGAFGVTNNNWVTASVFVP